MLKRRLKQARLPAHYSPHSFPANRSAFNLPSLTKVSTPLGRSLRNSSYSVLSIRPYSLPFLADLENSLRGPCSGSVMSSQRNREPSAAYGHKAICYQLFTSCHYAFVTDSQGLQQPRVNLPGDRQSLRRLKPANRLDAARANHPVNSAMVIATPGKFRLH